MSTPSLFRREVAESRQAQWLGSVRLHRSLSFTVVTCVALALGAALIGFATWGEVNRKTRLSGLLVAAQGSLNITAPHSGTLMSVSVVEGQRVAKGETLMVLVVDRQSEEKGLVRDTGTRVEE